MRFPVGERGPEFNPDFCWCEQPCASDECPTRAHWLEVDSSEIDGD